MARGAVWIGVEPDVWFLVFHRETPHWWLRWVGRFKHVSAYALLPDSGVWVFYDVMLGRTRVAALLDGPTAEAEIARAEAGGVVLAVRPLGERRHWFRVGFWCVPAMAHLIGLRTWALRPDGLFAACLRAGAVRAEWNRP